MMSAAQAGMVEVKLGEVAAQKATKPDVKEFGAMMVSDHSKANNELKAIAAKSTKFEKDFWASEDIDSFYTKHPGTNTTR